MIYVYGIYWLINVFGVVFFPTYIQSFLDECRWNYHESMTSILFFSLSLKTSVIVELSLHKLYIASNLYFIESFLFKCENNISSVIIDIDFLIFRVKWDGKPTIVEAIGQNIKEMCVTSAYVKQWYQKHMFQWRLKYLGINGLLTDNI